ncbi:MAG: hypothetical protein AAF517_06435 [Planctomycetota bacterium]
MTGKMVRGFGSLCLILSLGCSRAPHSTPASGGSEPEPVDGGVVESPGREKASEYLQALARVQSVDEEAKLLTDFSEWLNLNGYKIRVEEANGKHTLSCPYFPPVTPWVEHRFLDARNVELLPRLPKEG